MKPLEREQQKSKPQRTQSEGRKALSLTRTDNRAQKRNPHRPPLCPLWLILYFFSVISTVARVFSQSRYMWQPVPISWNEIVKFSTGAAVFDTLMS